MEKYGTVPDKFTKAWWDHIWYYYKWHFFGILLTVFLIVITAAECASKINYDAEINYVGNVYYNDEKAVDKMCAELGERISDVNGNGKNQVYFRQITIAKEGTPESLTEYNGVMITKVAIEFQSGESYLYLFSSQELHRIIDRDSDEIIFQNPYDYLTGEIDEESIVKHNDQPCAVALPEDSAFLADYPISDESVYLALVKIRERDRDKEEQQKKCENAVKLANYIFGEH